MSKAEAMGGAPAAGGAAGAYDQPGERLTVLAAYKDGSKNRLTLFGMHIVWPSLPISRARDSRSWPAYKDIQGILLTV